MRRRRRNPVSGGRLLPGGNRWTPECARCTAGVLPGGCMHRRVGNAHARFSATPEPDGKWRQRRLSAWHFCRGGVWAYRFAGAAVSWKRMRSRRGRRWFRAPFRSRNRDAARRFYLRKRLTLRLCPLWHSTVRDTGWAVAAGTTTASWPITGARRCCCAALL